MPVFDGGAVPEPELEVELELELDDPELELEFNVVLEVGMGPAGDPRLPSVMFGILGMVVLTIRLTVWLSAIASGAEAVTGPDIGGTTALQPGTAGVSVH